MKKKLLLIALPALMVLSGCSNALVEQPVNNNNEIVLEEDTLAHEEIFGGQAIKGPAIRKMSDVGVDTDYKVGYQIHFDDKGTVDDSDDVISIRFIAALKANYATMRWTRGITDGAGAEVKALSDHRRVAEEDVYFDSKVVYTHLANGEGNDEMDATVGAYSEYTGFIVYSLLNIPYSDNIDAYLGVTLTLTPSEGDAVQTGFYAVKIEKNGAGTASAHTFKFASNKDGFFLAKGESVIDADGSVRGDNAASFTANLAANETFLVVQKTASLFKVWDGWRLGDEDANITNDNGLVKVATASKYVFYLNKGDEIYHTKYEEPTIYYVRGDAAGGWDVTEESSYRMVSDPDNKGVLLDALLTKDGGFKIGGITWDVYDLGADRLLGGAKDLGYVSGTSGNIQCNRTAYYNLYLTNNDFISVEWVRDA